MTTDTVRIVVVGGGIWGLSTAYHLARTGSCQVTLVERNEQVAAETTPRAAGLVGQIRESATMCSAVQYALQLFTEFTEETGYDLGLRRPGSLMVALTDARMEAYARQVESGQQNGLEAQFVSDQEMERLAPHLNVSALAGGFIVAGDGYVDSGLCAQGFAQAARELGVRFRCATPVTGLDVEAGTVKGVRTAEGRISADAVVLTGGPWTASLLRQWAGYELATATIRHQRVITVPQPGIPAHHPVVRITDESCYLRPEAGGGYLYGFFEPEPTLVDFDEEPAAFTTDGLEPPVETMSEARRRLLPVFPVLEDLEIAERRQGVTTFAPDGNFMLGPVPHVAGLFCASGCAALGIAGSAAVGRWIASWILEGDPGGTTTNDEFTVGRFGNQQTDRDWVNRGGAEFYANYYSIR
jgi:glycine/D-amino acid oxidase-like deaminating enzyme